ncbi:MAG: response regulator transcription factor [Clostridia bacterium]|nr:response regulator transcription factor [Clostridia bacterium]
MVEKIWGYDYIGESRIIDDLVKRIRKKLEAVESELEIKTVWGYGYKIDA